MLICCRIEKFFSCKCEILIVLCCYHKMQTSILPWQIVRKSLILQLKALRYSYRACWCVVKSMTASSIGQEVVRFVEKNIRDRAQTKRFSHSWTKKEMEVKSPAISNVRTNRLESQNRWQIRDQNSVDCWS